MKKIEPQSKIREVVKTPFGEYRLEEVIREVVPQKSTPVLRERRKALPAIVRLAPKPVKELKPKPSPYAKPESKGRYF